MMVLFFCIALKQWQSTYRSCCHYATSVNRNHPKQAAFSISSRLFTFILKKSYVQLDYRMAIIFFIAPIWHMYQQKSLSHYCDQGSS